MRFVLITISILGWSLWAIFNKLALQKLHPLQMQIVGCIVGISLVPLYMYLLSFVQTTTISLNTSGIVLTVLASICATVAGFAYLIGIRDGELGTISVLTSAYPLLTFAMSVFLFNERITMVKLVGIILVLIGVVVIGR
jgi:transporter family protein